MDRPRVAIAHDYLTQRGGAERVVLSMHRAFPDATIYTTMYNPDTTYPEFKDARIVTSWLNRVEFFREHHRLSFPLLAPASSSMRIDADVVLTSSSAWAHGFQTTGRKLVYCHSPAHHLYQTDEYLGHSAHSTVTGMALLAFRPWLTRWDKKAAASAAAYLCNSRISRERILKTYGIEAAVVPPPPGVSPTLAQEALPELADWAGSGYFLAVTRLMPYKNVHHLLNAFALLPQERVVVVGQGPMADELRAMAPANARMFSGLSDAQLRWVYAHSTALVAPSFEDFGLAPLEAGMFGKPCAALRGGGFLDTIEEGTTGLYFDSPDPESIAAAVGRMTSRNWDANAIRAHADLFSEEHFQRRIQDAVHRVGGLAGATTGGLIP